MTGVSVLRFDATLASKLILTGHDSDHPGHRDDHRPGSNRQARHDLDPKPQTLGRLPSGHGCPGCFTGHGRGHRDRHIQVIPIAQKLACEPTAQLNHAEFGVLGRILIRAILHTPYESGHKLVFTLTARMRQIDRPGRAINWSAPSVLHDHCRDHRSTDLATQPAQIRTGLVSLRVSDKRDSAVTRTEHGREIGQNPCPS
jgi:hypothetical protein